MAYTQTLKNRAQPSPAWIESVRANYPVESTLDDVLTTKLRNRTRTGAHKTDFEALEQRLIAYIKSVTGQSDARVSNLNRLTGGASKEQFTFDLTWNKNAGEDPSGERETCKLILRMDPAESVVETHRLREAQVLRAMWGEVPVPEVFWVEPSAEKLGHPFLIAGFLDGTVQPDDGGKVTGLGMYFEPRLREALKDQFIQHLAAIHTVDWRQKDLSAYDTPEAGTTQANEWSLGLWERIWQEDTLEAHPVMEQAAIWLKENMPVVDNPVIVHGDYRSGNFMYDVDLKINAIFDWELAYLGDYHDDLAWASLPIFGGPDEHGNTLASSLMPTEEFLKKYEQFSGNRVDHDKLRYYQVFSFYKISVIAAATSIRVAYSRKTHLDAMMNFSGGIGYVGISQLNRLLDAVD